ncbi:MAG: DNA repair protein RecN [Kineosporiaceae bacterium]
MLLEMRLRCLGVITESVLEFGPGLTVVTGETGAGKTMVVSGLGLLLGGRADAGVVRTGSRAAVVEGRVSVDPEGSVARRAVDAGGELDGEELLLSRSVSAEGRSRAVIGGRGAPVGLLAELGSDLVVVHGQTDQIRLRSSARQRQALDRFAAEEVGAPLERYRDRYQRWLRVRRELEEVTSRARERAHEAELLRLGRAEVARVDPRPGEDHELKAEAQRLAHAEDLRLAAGSAHACLTGDPSGDSAGDVVTAVAAARRALDAVRSHDETLARLADRFAELGYLVNDLAADCAAYAASVEADPARLAAVEDRRATLAAMTRAHGTDVDGVLAWAQGASARLADLDDSGDRTARLAQEVASLREALAVDAVEVGRARRGAAVRLGEAVSAELQALSMPDARLVVEVSALPAEGADDEASVTVTGASGEPSTLRLGPDGADVVTFQLVPHPGAPARPLAKGASGGELSRVMLALEIVLGGVDPVPTFVFDEVDAGVGGRAALNIGRRLAMLARSCQVLVVTHLPQVAAFADRHLLVSKSADGAVTTSGVQRLDDDGRVRELARMLAGLEDSGTAQAHARELLADAEAWRSAATAGEGGGVGGSSA